MKKSELRQIIREELNEKMDPKYYGATVKHKKSKLEGEVVRWDNGVLTVRITKGKNKGANFKAEPKEVDLITGYSPSTSEIIKIEFSEPIKIDVSKGSAKSDVKALTKILKKYNIKYDLDFA